MVIIIDETVKKVNVCEGSFSCAIFLILFHICFFGSVEKIAIASLIT